MKLRLIHPGGDTSEVAMASAVARLGRDPGCEVAFDPAAYPKVSGEHARIERTASGLVLTPLSRSNKTLLNDRPVEGPAPLRVGDRIRLGYSGPAVEVLSAGAPAPGPALGPEPGPEYGTTVQAEPQHFALLRGSLAAERFEVGPGGVIGREKGKVRFLLDHP